MLRNKAMLLLAVLISLLLTSCGNQNSEVMLSSEVLILPQQANYKTVTVKKMDYLNQVEGKVSVVYPVTEDIRMEKENARFRESHVLKGDRIQQGDPLMTFEMEGSTAMLKELELKCQRAQEDFEKESLKRREAIAEAVARSQEMGLSLEEWEIAKLKVESLETSYEQFVYQKSREQKKMAKELQELKEDIQDNVLTAPVSGVVKFINTYSVGDKVPVGSVLMTFYSTDTFLLKADDVKGVMDYNMEVIVETGNDKDRKSYRGRVVSAPNILPAEAAQEVVYVKLDQAVSPEEFNARSTFICYPESLKDALLVDKKAVHREGDRYYVYLLEDDIPKKRYVVVGVENNQWAWIVDGLSEGQLCVLD